MTHSFQKHGFVVISFFIVEAIVFIGLLLHAHYVSGESERLKNETIVMEKLMLTDLCLVTESRHTRHIAQPELIAPFQDIPGFHDHFPSSTFLQPPRQIGEPKR